jgi:rare lipoprotein A
VRVSEQWVAVIQTARTGEFAESAARPGYCGSISFGLPALNPVFAPKQKVLQYNHTKQNYRDIRMYGRQEVIVAFSPGRLRRGRKMRSIDGGHSYSGLDERKFSQAASACAPGGLRLFAVAVMVAMLAACTQHTVITDKSAVPAPSRYRPAEPSRIASSILHRRVAVAVKKRAPIATAKSPSASHGIASFYNEGTITANGEKFVPSELTAAHRTLPFGTRLRVTDVATGQSVTVRINDRGPFISGRVVDLSQSAAETLGIVDRGVAKVKLDVVE